MRPATPTNKEIRSAIYKWSNCVEWDEEEAHRQAKRFLATHNPIHLPKASVETTKAEDSVLQKRLAEVRKIQNDSRFTIIGCDDSDGGVDVDGILVMQNEPVVIAYKSVSRGQESSDHATVSFGHWALCIPVMYLTPMQFRKPLGNRSLVHPHVTGPDFSGLRQRCHLCQGTATRRIDKWRYAEEWHRVVIGTFEQMKVYTFEGVDNELRQWTHTRCERCKGYRETEVPLCRICQWTCMNCQCKHNYGQCTGLYCHKCTSYLCPSCCYTCLCCGNGQCEKHQEDECREGYCKTYEIELWCQKEPDHEESKETESPETSSPAAEICPDCEHPTEDCECDRCGQCGLLEENCECPACSECNYTAEYCECVSCSGCDDQPLDCGCEPCPHCGSNYWNCGCECPVCEEGMFPPCDCPTCTECGNGYVNCGCMCEACEQTANDCRRAGPAHEDCTFG